MSEVRRGEHTPIGRLIADARLKQHPAISQRKAAGLVGVTRGMFNYYERGTYEPPERVLRILAREWKAPELLKGLLAEPTTPEGSIRDLGDVPAKGWDEITANAKYTQVPLEYVADDHGSARINGSSMAPTLLPRDRVVIKITSDEPPVGKIAIVQADCGEVMIKRYVKVSGVKMLVADNHDIAAVVMQKCQFLGYIIALYHRDL